MKARLLVLALVIGAVDALMLKLFEFLVNDGTQWLWNDVFHTDVYRWREVVLAGILGMLFAGVLIFTRQERIPKPKIDLLAEEAAKSVPTLHSIARNLGVGLSSLLAGASLGPEAPLMSFSSDTGEWVARKTGLSKPAIKVLSVASIGALLVAFLGSLIMLLVPLLEVWAPKNKLPKQTKLQASVPIVLAGVGAYGTLALLDPTVSGWGSLPPLSHTTGLDWVLALVVGIIGAGFGWGLKHLILRLHKNVTTRILSGIPGPLSGLMFGLVLGILYVFGGSTSEFNGSHGSPELYHHVPAYSLTALIIIVIAKLLATAWSMAAGYRGGLVFPSIYCGVAVFMGVHALFNTASNGVLVGSIAGILGALISPVMGGIFVMALLPAKLLPLAIVGIVGSVVGNKLIKRMGGAEPTQS